MPFVGILGARGVNRGNAGPQEAEGQEEDAGYEK
jgi:hypothetical protein